MGHSAISSLITGSNSNIVETAGRGTPTLNPAILHALADIAIELRSPLSVILGHAENIRQTADEGDYEAIRSIAAIEKNGRRIDRFTSDILALGALEHEISQHETAPRSPSFQFEECIGDLRDRFSQLIRDKRPSLSIQASPSDCRIPGDRYYWSIAFQHLLENALAENARGLEMKIAAQRLPGKTIIEFVDNGIGIPPNDLSHVCEPFYRIQRERNPPRRGIGMGLHYVQRVAHYHNGELSVSSIPGVQTTLRIILSSAQKGN
ncbi:MAG: two-component system phosphate regulon sensor histidine kinase PhoR [Verrucomicrobiales bacterium]